VLAISREDGSKIWCQELKGSDFVNVVYDGMRLFAATRGELFCLDPETGGVRWHNELKGCGWGLISIAGAGISSNALPPAAEKGRREEQRSASTAASAGAA